MIKYEYILLDLEDFSGKDLVEKLNGAAKDGWRFVSNISLRYYVACTDRGDPLYNTDQIALLEREVANHE